MLKTKSNTRTFKLEEDNGDLIITKSDGTGTAVRIGADGNASYAKGVSGEPLMRPPCRARTLWRWGPWSSTPV
ncbi:hypothetical protein N6H14_12670 [Paenibacillus sp. CC-CFT747]|nr:hypothetical protein N6H14_12670 [Paenibacillus sp. CC-CFT747]